MPSVYRAPSPPKPGCRKLLLVTHSLEPLPYKTQRAVLTALSPHFGLLPRVDTTGTETNPAGFEGKEETEMTTLNGRRFHALYRVWIVQK